MGIVRKWNLHQAGDKAGWELVARDNRNPWQRLAFSTKGVVTPANILSIAGAALVGLGLWSLYEGDVARGFALVAAGRLADVLDGVVAQATGTKSRLGEALDAGIDKITIFAALPVFVAAGVVPVFAAALIAVRNGTNAFLGLRARARQKTLHPSLAGKFASGVEWASVLLFTAAVFAARQGWALAETVSFTAAALALAAALAFGSVAMAEYRKSVR